MKHYLQAEWEKFLAGTEPMDDLPQIKELIRRSYLSGASATVDIVMSHGTHSLRDLAIELEQFLEQIPRDDRT